MPVRDLSAQRDGEPSAAIKARVNRARAIQKERYQRHRHMHCNGQMGAREIKKHCLLDPASLALLEKAVARLGLSARAYHRILKIGRTIADLDGSPAIGAEHIAEAIQYRRMEQKT